MIVYDFDNFVYHFVLKNFFTEKIILRKEKLSASECDASADLTNRCDRGPVFLSPLLPICPCYNHDHKLIS